MGVYKIIVLVYVQTAVPEFLNNRDTFDSVTSKTTGRYSSRR